VIRFARVLVWSGLAASLAACGGEASRPVLHLLSRSYDFSIQPSDIPPHAREAIVYKVVVRDRKTQEPIDNGEGQIFADMGQTDGPHTWDALQASPELGTYRAKLNFVVAGPWAMAVRFRRHPTDTLERVDWMQDVFNERPDSTP
jgi:hypothetical protein